MEENTLLVIEYLLNEINVAMSKISENEYSIKLAKEETGESYLGYKLEKQYGIVNTYAEEALVKENAKKIRKLLLKLY